MEIDRGTLTILPASAEDPQQIVFNWRDVTQRKGIKERLRNIDGRLRDIINHSPIVVTEFDAHGTIVIAEGSGVRIVSSAVGNSMFDLYADCPEVITAIQQVLMGETVTSRMSLAGRWFDVWGRPVRRAEGSVSGGITVATDITHRVLAEQTLAQEKEQFRVLVDNASGLILMFHTSGKILFASPSVEKLTGYKVEDIVGRDGFELMHPDDVPSASEAAFQAFGNPMRYSASVSESDARTASSVFSKREAR